MSTFYIKTKDNIVYELTATTDVAFQHRSTVTKFPVESGVEVSDHTTVENSTFTLNGVITDVVRLDQFSVDKGVKDYIQGLDKLRNSKQFFTVFLDNKLKPFKNCLFTGLSYSKTQAEGLSGWRVSLSIEQVIVADKAKASAIKVAPTSSTEEGDKKTADGSKADPAKKDLVTEKKDEGNKPSVTMFESGRRLGGDLLGKGVEISKEFFGVDQVDGVTGG